MDKFNNIKYFVLYLLILFFLVILTNYFGYHHDNMFQYMLGILSSGLTIIMDTTNI